VGLSDSELVEFLTLEAIERLGQRATAILIEQELAGMLPGERIGTIEVDAVLISRALRHLWYAGLVARARPQPDAERVWVLTPDAAGRRRQLRKLAAES